MQCHNALQSLTEKGDNESNTARQHVLTCPACLARFDQLARAILLMSEDEISCAECRAQLPAFYEVEEQSEEIPARFPAVAGHLARCPDCTEEYHALKETLAARDGGILPELTQRPTFDLSSASAKLGISLETEPGGRSLWLTETVGQIRELFSEIVITLGARGASFGPLPSRLTPSLAPARVFRAEDGEGQAQVLVLPDPSADVSIQLSVGPVADDRAAIGLRLSQVESGEPLPDTRVMLYDAERHLLAGSVTEADGRVIFRDLRAGRYIIQVRRNSHRWELPLLIR